MRPRTKVAPRAVEWRDDAPRSFRWEGESAPPVRTVAKRSTNETFTLIRHVLRPETPAAAMRRFPATVVPARSRNTA